MNTKTYYEMAAEARQLQADTYRAEVNAEAVSPFCPDKERQARCDFLMKIATDYDQMAENYRTMIPNAPEGNTQ